MVYSMTGFGRAEQAVGDKNFLVELKSLNGKQMELRLFIPQLLKPYEIEIRNILAERLQRGTVECVITLKQNGGSRPVNFNADLAKAYYQPIANFAQENNLDMSQLLPSLLKMPEIVTPTNDALSEDEWNAFSKVLHTAIDKISEHRKDEGKSLEEDLVTRIANITVEQKKIMEMEPARRVKIKQGLEKLLEENVGADNYDKNRLEQEIIYYIEKIDISEEQVRLTNHCNYFTEILNQKETAKGKKLSFILQEMGREINTTGSKANDAAIQRSVVQMKDELEKAKEQVLNVL